ncbi:hypothetical protein AXF42_Ash011829 [Apostasia shenzhenica]|uniref:Glycosyltransferase 61 catalytic domain-containing protein n=1 Tax=Apostasia shenzhenica TaxID=1088818 RepID=A0A2I0AVY2_9ASPA|nr:hypothetical protein AXF42_Ash011829 [Apostasia shenzhenica]
MGYFCASVEGGRPSALASPLSSPSHFFSSSLSLFPVLYYQAAVGLMSATLIKNYVIVGPMQLCTTTARCGEKKCVCVQPKKSGGKPRLLVRLRKRSRELIYRGEVVQMAEELGFRAVVAGAEVAKNITRYSSLVNSVDALLGVHGAGLTNMVFLPARAAVIQIVPWGRHWRGRDEVLRV